MTKTIHGMPILCFQNQAFIGLIQDKIVFLSAIVIIDMTAALYANSGLLRFFMPVSPAR
jgi:hypothetical protein